MSKDLPPDNDRKRPDGSRGACVTRVESFMRAISFSCTEVIWHVQWQR